MYMSLGIHSEHSRWEIAVAWPMCGKEAIFTEPFLFVQSEEMANSQNLPKVKFNSGYAVVRFPKIFPWRAKENQWTKVSFGGERPVWGVISCRSCPCRRKHKLDWPQDAFYKVEVCNDVLWGWSRDHFVSIRDFISSKDRDLGKRPNYSWLHKKIPAHFLNVKRRAAVVKAIDRFLKDS